MSTDVVQIETRESRLEHLPISFFASMMGLSGLALAWQKGVHVLHIASEWVPLVIAAAAALVFLTLLGLYGAKVALHPSHVVGEYRHPVKLHFFPAVSISLLLLSILALNMWPAMAMPLFAVGASLHLVLMLLVLNSWFNHDHFQTVHLNPAWFIPAVGNVLVPLSGVALGYVELSWFFFAIGIMFWIVLFTIIINRVLFHNPLPERLAPTLFILIAPPAVGFLSYVRLTGNVDAAAHILYYFALFMTLFLITQVPRLMRAAFFLSWWAYSFPLAAVTIASLTMYEKIGGTAFFVISAVLLGIVTTVVTALVVRTLVAIGRGRSACPNRPARDPGRLETQ